MRKTAMSHYKNATYRTFHFGKEAAESQTCEVRIMDDGEIVVSYETDGDFVVYKGEEQGQGHYLLESEEPQGRASLHRFPGSLILEGYWEEDGMKGMWRIELGEVADDVSGEAGESPTERLSDDPGLLAELSHEADSEAEEELDDWGPIMRKYRFPLRDDQGVIFRLPDDLTRREGQRLASFIESLSYTN
jgi:hypothetical protein